MRKQRGGSLFIFGGVGMLLLLGVVAVIVLAVLGVFNKTSTSSSGGGSTQACIAKPLASSSYCHANFSQITCEVQFEYPASCSPAPSNANIEIELVGDLNAKLQPSTASTGDTVIIYATGKTPVNRVQKSPYNSTAVVKLDGKQILEMPFTIFVTA